MGTPLAPAKIAVGDRIKDLWQIKKKLGEGSCGIVFLVQNLKYSGPEGRAAMKVEPFMKSKDDEILKMEVFVMRKLQKSKHACRLLLAGKERNYSFLIMTLLGKELSELRRKYPDRKMPVGATLKIGLQAIEAIYDLHSVGFVHRDVKPTNYAFGALNKGNLYIFDFGLARQIFISDHGKPKLREPRNKVSFRGTVRYCSINVHHYKEQGRHDDLWSCLKGMARRDSGNLKETVSEKTLCAGCPPSFAEMSTILKKLTYNDTPPYSSFHDMLKKDLAATKTKLTDPFDWEVVKEKKKIDDETTHKEEKTKKEKDEQAEIDQMEDTDTFRDVDESVDSAMSDQESQTKGFAREDTLDNVADVKNEK